MTVREFKDVAMATVFGGAAIALVCLLSAAIAELPLSWLFGHSQLGLALAKYGPFMLVPFLAMLLSMWVFLRIPHVPPSPAVERERHKA